MARERVLLSRGFGMFLGISRKSRILRVWRMSHNPEVRVTEEQKVEGKQHAEDAYNSDRPEPEALAIA